MAVTKETTPLPGSVTGQGILFWGQNYKLQRCNETERPEEQRHGPAGPCAEAPEPSLERGPRPADHTGTCSPGAGVTGGRGETGLKRGQKSKSVRGRNRRTYRRRTQPTLPSCPSPGDPTTALPKGPRSSHVGTAVVNTCTGTTFTNSRTRSRHPDREQRDTEQETLRANCKEKRQKATRLYPNKGKVSRVNV